MRLQRDVLAQIDERKVLIKNLSIEKGEYRDFGFVRLRADGKVRVRVIGVWALRLTTKFVKENLPLPKVRIFSWLQVQQK